MGFLPRFEQRLEQLVTGAFARVFRSAVQPVEIAAALQREVDNSAQILSRDRRLAPNTFEVELAASDYDRLSPYGGPLTTELTGSLRQHAGDQNYVFAGPLTINFVRSEEMSTGRLRVTSAALAEVTPATGKPPTETTIGRAPVILELNGMRHPLEPPGLVIGRGAEADLRINDAGVSRRHLEFRVVPFDDTVNVSVVDLGSTNGTTLNGHRIQQATLSDGDRLHVGNTDIVVRNPQAGR